MTYPSHVFTQGKLKHAHIKFRTQMFINWGVAKQIAVHPYDEELSSNKKEWTTDVCYSINESQRHYAFVKVAVRSLDDSISFWKK